MTYCVALRLNRGLVFAADTRTSAGNDNVAVFRKLYYWRKPGERVIVLCSAGNLAITQSVISLLNEHSVGLPIDLLVYERDSLDVRREKRIEQDDEYFRKLSAAWSEALRTAFARIEEFKL